VVFLCLPNATIVEEVIFGENALVHGSVPPPIVVDCGTTAYMSTLDFVRRLQSLGITFADAPDTGMEARARDAILTLMFGGNGEVLERLRPALEAIGKTVVHLGGVGTGQLGKLVNNLLFNINIAARAEILPMAVKLGLDPEKVNKVITTGTGRSFAVEFFVPLILDGRFDQGYTLQKAYKDMISGLELSAHHNIPLPVSDSAAITYKMALAAGYGSENKAAMIKVFERILGVEFRKREKDGYSNS
jgi:3-hydroxyisobutyrate dehydrogenase-like beta-hydroxyacid dehydrogenase